VLNVDGTVKRGKTAALYGGHYVTPMPGEVAYR